MLESLIVENQSRPRDGLGLWNKIKRYKLLSALTCSIGLLGAYLIVSQTGYQVSS
jgi:hypothetical protein